jgi:hypothetical protein
MHLQQQDVALRRHLSSTAWMLLVNSSKRVCVRASATLQALCTTIRWLSGTAMAPQNPRTRRQARVSVDRRE